MKAILKKVAASIVVLALVFTTAAPWPGYAQTDENLSDGSAAANQEVVELTGFEYTLDEAAQTVTLEKYKGTDKAVVVCDAYLVNGKEYKTVLNTKTVFLNNTSITSVKICSGVSFKDNSMSHLFSGCKGLTSVDLTEINTKGVTDMSFMFYYCLKLASIDVSAFDTSAVTTFESLFDRCQKVTSLTGYENWNTSNVVKIYKAFNRVSFDYLDDKYKDVRLQCIDISKWDLDQINNSGWCFQQCRVNSILLPDNLSTMSAGFMNHAAQFVGTSLTIPVGVKKIGYAHTFYDMGTNDFVEIKVAEGNKYYKSVDGVLYSADGKELLGVPRNKPFENNVFEIPEGVTFLAELCFSRNQNFHTIVLPDSYVMRQFVQDNDPRYQVFEDNGNINWGNSLSIATYLYTAVANYEVKDTNPNYASHEGILYTKDMKKLLAVPILYDKVLRVPEGVERWESYAIWDDISHTYYKNFKGVSIPASMIYIGRDQLKRLNLLKEKFSTFTIEVDEDNPVYRLDEKGYLEAYAISPQAIILDTNEFEYDGTAKEPVVKVSFDDQEFIDERIASHLGDNLSIDGLIEYLEEGVDYTVTYENNTEAGTATVVVKGIGKYSGTATKNFTINPCKHIWDDGKVTKTATCTAEGVMTFKCTVPGCDMTKTEAIAKAEHTYNTYYTIDKKATMSADGSKSKHCSKCSAKTSVTVIPNISTVKLSTTAYNYNDKTKTPAVTVIDSEGATLKNGIDYSVVYSSGRTKIGKYKVTVTFKGFYSGSKALYFTIGPKKPATVKAYLYGHDDVKMTWSKVPGASGYKVYYKKVGASEYTYLKTTTGTSYKKENLADGTKYYFKVFAYKIVDGNKCINAGTANSVYTLKKVSGVKAAKYGTKVKISWTNIDAESGYQISKSATKGKTGIITTYKTTKGKSKTISATKGETYYYKVRAYKTVGGKRIYGPWSSIVKYKR